MPNRPEKRSQARFLARLCKSANPARRDAGLSTSNAGELKFDGWRVQAHLLQGGATIYTRGGHDWTRKFSGIAECVKHLPAERMILDGEIVSADPEKGRSNFSQLQSDIKTGRQDRLTYYVFDLLYFDGFDLRGSPLAERRRVLEEFLREADKSAGRIMLSEEFEDGAELYKNACKLDLEGIIAKRRDSPYRSERGEEWLKIKCLKQADFFIVGFVPGPGGFSRLRLAHKVGGKLVYCGRVGTGWNAATMRELRSKLDRLQVSRCPLDAPLKKPGTIWVRPKLRAVIAHTELTDDGMLRHPSFKGLA